MIDIYGLSKIKEKKRWDRIYQVFSVKIEEEFMLNITI